MACGCQSWYHIPLPRIGSTEIGKTSWSVRFQAPWAAEFLQKSVTLSREQVI